MSTFEPGTFVVTAITNASPAVVTTATDHDILPGEIVSFRIPHDAGMVQLNNKYSRVLDITDDTLTIDTDTLQFVPFTYVIGQIYPQVVSAASGKQPGVSIPTIALQTCFDNVP